MAPTLTTDNSMPIDMTDAKRSEGGDLPGGEGHDKKMTAAPITPAGMPPKFEGNQDSKYLQRCDGNGFCIYEHVLIVFSPSKLKIIVKILLE